MRGYPKNLNTKEDYLFVVQNFSKDEWEQDFQDLLSGESDWMFVRPLPNKEAGVVDTYHKVVENSDPMSGQTTYAQYEWKSNPDAKIYKLGFTVQEVQNIIDNGVPVGA